MAAPAPPQVPQGGFAIFVDDAPRSRLDADAGDADDWPDFGTLQERVKENERGPTPWAEAALEAPKPKAAASLGFSLYVDDDLAPPEPAAPPAPIRD